MTTANNPVVTDAMIAAGASKVAEMCGHDEEPRGWDKDVARNVYLAMIQASPDEPRNRILEQVRKDREAFARLPKDQQQSALNELKSIGQNPGVTFEPPPDEMGAERVKLADRTKKLRAERKRYFDVEGDGVDVLLIDIQDHFDRAALQSIGPMRGWDALRYAERRFDALATACANDGTELGRQRAVELEADTALIRAALKSIGIEDQG